MIFNSYQFWGFFALVVLLYRFLGHRRQNHLLLAASYFFYACWDWRFLGLIIGITAVHFVAALKIEQGGAAERRRWLAGSVAISLVLLGVFKYLNFFIESTGLFLSRMGFEAHFESLSIILPVGISFYTFQTLSYTLDVYRGRARTESSLLNFALYATFFPQLVAGPIVRSTQFLPQCQE